MRDWKLSLVRLVPIYRGWRNEDFEIKNLAEASDAEFYAKRVSK